MTERQKQEKVKSDWAMYRLVFAGFSYNTVFHQMSPQEIELANAALDEQIRQENRRYKKR